jgi:hypothetical protein
MAAVNNHLEENPPGPDSNVKVKILPEKKCTWPGLDKRTSVYDIRNCGRIKDYVLSISLSVFSASSFIRADILLEDE